MNVGVSVCVCVCVCVCHAGDAGDVLVASRDAGAMSEKAVTGFRAFVLEALEYELIHPLCQQIETDLRYVCVCLVSRENGASRPAVKWRSFHSTRL